MLVNRLSGREKTLFISGAIIVACILVYIFAFEPIWTEWKKLNELIYSKSIKLVKNRRILGQEKQITKFYNEYAKDIKMEGSVEEETAKILKEIENIARTSSTYIADIKPNKVKDMGFYKEYFVELEAEGDIANLAKFIYELQDSKQILKVRHLRINPKAGENNKLKGYMIVTKVLIP